MKKKAGFVSYKVVSLSSSFVLFLVFKIKHFTLNLLSSGGTLPSHRFSVPQLILQWHVRELGMSLIITLFNFYLQGKKGQRPHPDPTSDPFCWILSKANMAAGSMIEFSNLVNLIPQEGLTW